MKPLKGYRRNLIHLLARTRVDLSIGDQDGLNVPDQVQRSVQQTAERTRRWESLMVQHHENHSVEERRIMFHQDLESQEVMALLRAAPDRQSQSISRKAETVSIYHRGNRENATLARSRDLNSNDTIPYAEQLALFPCSTNGGKSWPFDGTASLSKSSEIHR